MEKQSSAWLAQTGEAKQHQALNGTQKKFISRSGGFLFAKRD